MPKLEQGIRDDTGEARKGAVAAIEPSKMIVKQEPTQVACARWYVLGLGRKAGTGICRRI